MFRSGKYQCRGGGILLACTSELQFKTGLDEKLYDDFVKASSDPQLLQSAKWAKVKSGWAHEFAGIFRGDEQIGACLILIKRLPLGFTMMYIPRGPVMDLTDMVSVKFFTDSLRRWAAAKRALFVKIDPDVVYAAHHKEEQRIVNRDAERSVAALMSAGFIHMGFTTGMSTTIQPRFHMVCRADEYGEESFTGKGRRNYRTAAKNKFLTTELRAADGLDDFEKVMKCTASRKGVSLRDKKYYGLLLDTYGNDAFLMLTYFDLQEAYDENGMLLDRCRTDAEACPATSPKKLAKIKETLESLEKKESEYSAQLADYGGRVCVAGTLTVMYGRRAEILYAGADNAFRRLNAPYLTWDMTMRECFRRGMTEANMGGITGEGDGLETFKSSFHPLIYEYAGEFDLPVNRILYGPAKKFYMMRR